MNEEQEIDTVVQKIYQIFKENQCFWVLSGSTSLRLQGVAVPVKKDIDIITNAENAKKIDQVLKEYVIQPSAFSATDKYQSYFGIYEIDGVNVEVMGEFRYRMKNGEWSKPNQENEIHYVMQDTMALPVLTLEQEMQEYLNMDRMDKVEKIQARIAQKEKSKKVVGTMFFKDGKLLIDKPRKRPTFQMIGGSVEPGESIREAAIRECHEELGEKAIFDEEKLEFVMDFEEIATSDPNLKIHMHIFQYPEELQGELTTSEEIESFYWFGKNDDEAILSNTLKHKIIPFCIEKGLIE